MLSAVQKFYNKKNYIINFTHIDWDRCCCRTGCISSSVAGALSLQKKAPVSSPIAELLLRQWQPGGELHSHLCMSAPHRPFYLAELNPSPCIVNSTLFAHQICKKVPSCMFRISKYKYTCKSLWHSLSTDARREGGCAFANRTLPPKTQGCLAEI
jgi:hypothetical protein